MVGGSHLPNFILLWFLLLSLHNDIFFPFSLLTCPNIPLHHSHSPSIFSTSPPSRHPPSYHLLPITPPSPSCFLFHNGGRCRRLLPNVQSITHVPVLVILIVSNTNVQCITHRCNQAALFYLVSQSLYFWIVTQQYYKFFQCSKWPKKLNVSTIHASTVQMYFCKSTPGRPRCIFCICSDLATVSPSQTILSLQCACKATCIILVFLNCKATPAYGTLLYLVICLSSTAVGGWWWWGRGGRGVRPHKCSSFWPVSSRYRRGFVQTDL